MYSELNAYINLLNEYVYTSAWLMAITISRIKKKNEIEAHHFVWWGHVRMLKCSRYKISELFLMLLFMIKWEQNEHLMATYYQE